MAGIHLHHHDLFDEGPESIARWLSKMDDLHEVFVQVNDIFERNPSPVGVLRRNPVHDVVMGSGKLYAQVDTRELSPELWQQRAASVDHGDDPLALVAASSIAERHRIVPWVNIANGDWRGDLEHNCVVDLSGRRVNRWLCPNGPDVAPMWGKVLGALIERHGFDTFLIDRIRYPDWAGEEVRPANLLTCFCETCLRLMVERGLDVELLRRMLTHVTGLVRAARFDEARSQFEHPVLQSWISFRKQSVTALVRAIRDRVRRRHPRAELWLDLWPPAYAWILGQDYSSLTRLSPRLKHFPYHRLGGGADVQSLIDSLGRGAAEREHAFRAFTRLFGIDYGQTYRQFRDSGFPIRLVEDQNTLVRMLSEPRTYVYSGVQMWNLPPDELYDAAVVSYSSAADDVIYYCYGWAASELIGAANGARSLAWELRDGRCARRDLPKRR